jgi:hypothetical protein
VDDDGHADYVDDSYGSRLEWFESCDGGVVGKGQLRSSILLLVCVDPDTLSLTGRCRMLGQF